MDIHLGNFPNDIQIRNIKFTFEAYTDLTRAISMLVFEMGNAGGFTTIVTVTFQYTLTKRFAVR